MTSSCSINADEMLDKFSKMDYSQLNDRFREAIGKSVQILKKATLSELAGSGLNISSPVHKGKSKYTPLKAGVQGEVAIDGTEGRVRIAPATRKGYGLFDGEGNFALKWFEGGTAERFRKGKGYHWEASSNKKQGGARKHRNKGASTGKAPAKHFFAKAINSTTEEITKQIEQDVNNAINNIMNE